jgi:hypothetical protein
VGERAAIGVAVVYSAFYIVAAVGLIALVVITTITGQPVLPIESTH